MSNRRYRESHEWAQAEGGKGVVTVGISQHAVEELGDIVYLELPEKGKKVREGETFGVIESVKAASDLYAPVGGEIVEVNGALANELGRFKEDPYGSAWLVKIRMSDAGQLDSLMDERAYEKHIAGD